MSQSDKRTAIGVVLAHLQSGHDITQKLFWDEQRYFLVVYGGADL